MLVTIRKFEDTDIQNKIKWINDENNNQYLHYDLPLEYEKTVAWFRRTEHSSNRYDAVIEANGVPVGIIGLLKIDFKNGKAEYYITMGEQGYKGKGIATKASLLLLEYAFSKLKLHKVYLFTEVDNIPAQKLFEKIGFKREGLLRSDLKSGDGFIDRYIYGIRVKDFALSTKATGSLVRPAKIGQSERNIISPLSELNQQICGNAIFVKREDLLPFSFGGNKARKADLFFQDLEAKGADCVVTYGTSSSNHCRVVANMAKASGLQCHIISPAEASTTTNNSRIIKLLDSNVIICTVDEVGKTIDETLGTLREQGFNPYFIEGGGHGNIGTQAYVDCYEEIVMQEKILRVHFDYIFLPSGTGTTQAGLVCGKLIRGDDRQIVGISIARGNPRGSQVVLNSVVSYMQSRNLNFNDLNSVQFIDDYVQDGYGSYNSEILDAIYRTFLSDGMPLDTTYTGKAFWGMQNYLQKRGIRDKNILFIHTGGTPLFFDDLGELVNDSE